eukprot:2557397-Lingulodinium_polyedra.AAC.1
MLCASGFPEPGALLKQWVVGFRVLGDIPDTGVFEPRLREAGQSLRDLLKGARAAQSLAREWVVASGDLELDAA